MLDTTPKGQEEEKAEKEKSEKAAEGGDSDSADTDCESDGAAGKGTPLEHCIANRRLLQKLNREVLALQGELRLLVVANPRLLPEVSVAQKERIFALAAELMQQMRGWAAQALRTSTRGE